MAEDSVKNATIINKEEYWKKYGHDLLELTKNQMVETNFPKSTWRYRIVYETYASSIEESYFWILNYFRYDMGFADIDKITDIFSGSELSAFGGVQQQRLGLQQDKVTAFLATIGKMIKDLFQLVRELRILDERLGYYRDCKSGVRKLSEPADITLKGLFIDMAEGGSKNPASVYGMARELQFTTLPDLFFGIHPKKSDEVDDMVENLDFNEAVKRVLKRKLYSYVRWKEETEKELSSRRTFTVDYLRQHFEIIKTYAMWVKPYLKNIQRMRSDEQMAETPDLIAAFEGSMVEIELLAKYSPEGNKVYKSCIIAHFDYRTRPSMNYVSEGYQRGPLHVGELKLTLREYAWTDKDIANYKKLREIEDLELIATIDSTIKAAMDSLGEDLMKYLSEKAGEEPGAKRAEEEAAAAPKIPSALDPFKSVFKGLGELTGSFIGSKAKKKKTAKADSLRLVGEKAKAAKDVRVKLWITYKNFKKAHKMIAW